MTGFTVDLAIARGLDYYTGVVFEADVEALGAEKQVLGGGRYELAQLFDLRPTPMTGFALGFDRLALALESEGRRVEPPVPSVYVIPFSDRDREGAQVLVAKLRGAGLAAEGDLMGRNMKKALSHASGRGARFIVFYGGDEKARGAVVLKDASSREQREVPEDGLVEELRALLG
jgi:histidyl-tRNA synthetase